MDAFSARRRPRAGFTLVEMLTVVTIIGVLAGLTVGAAVTAMTYVKKQRIKAEIAMLDMALKAYKEKFGDYPPDFSDQNAVAAHWGSAFPNATEAPPTGLTRAQALVFWLGGPTDPTTGVPLGFSQDPTKPLTGVGNRMPPLFDFDVARLRDDGNGRRVYIQPTTLDADPYVYFRSPYMANNTCAFQHNGETPATTTAAALSDVRGFCNPSSFQILAPGLDGRYGGDDDLGNFTIESEAP